MKQIFSFLYQSKKLKIIKYNKKIQKKLDLDINNYKKYYLQIEIEVIPAYNKYGKFMNYFNEKYKSFYHIYFNDNPKELKRNYIRKDDNVEKIKIIIDYEITVFLGI